MTYPFRFMPGHSVAPDAERPRAQLREINSNLWNGSFPTLRRRARVPTNPHFNEEPIDDAPAHNLVLWPRDRQDAIRPAN